MRQGVTCNQNLTRNIEFETIKGDGVDRGAIRILNLSKQRCDPNFEFEIDPVDEHKESRGADFEFEFETDLVNELEEVRKGWAFYGLTTPITKRGRAVWCFAQRCGPVDEQVELRSGR